MLDYFYKLAYINHKSHMKLPQGPLLRRISPLGMIFFTRSGVDRTTGGWLRTTAGATFLTEVGTAWLTPRSKGAKFEDFATALIIFERNSLIQHQTRIILNLRKIRGHLKRVSWLPFAKSQNSSDALHHLPGLTKLPYTPEKGNPVRGATHFAKSNDQIWSNSAKNYSECL